MLSNIGILVAILILTIILGLLLPTKEHLTFTTQNNSNQKNDYVNVNGYNIFYGGMPNEYILLNGQFLAQNKKIIVKDGIADTKMDLKSALAFADELAENCDGFIVKDEQITFFNKISDNSVLKDDSKSELYIKSNNAIPMSSSCPDNRLVAPNCPKDMISCNKDPKTCYNKETNKSYQTFYEDDKDWCPQLNNGKKDGIKPVVFGGVPMWERKVDKKACSNFSQKPQPSCNKVKLLGNKNCNGWSWIDTRFQQAYGLPSNIPPVYPDQFCWDESIGRCRQERPNDKMVNIQ